MEGNHMKKVRKTASFFLILSLILGLFSMLPLSTKAAETYNASAAIAYADAHWNDGVGLCAEFVSKCLAAGGISVPNYAYYKSTDLSYCGETFGAYVNPYIASAPQLKWLSMYYPVIKSPSHADMELGDIVFMNNTYSDPDGHVGIITGFSGTMPLYSAHNNDRHNAPIYSQATYVIKLGGTIQNCTIHTKGEYLWCEAAHPHYNYWTCATCAATFHAQSSAAMIIESRFIHFYLTLIRWPRRKIELSRIPLSWQSFFTVVWLLIAMRPNVSPFFTM